jgi:hypothetical protein
MELLLFGLAALFNAIMDTLEEGHFSNSIFKNLNPKFWYKDESWKYAKRIPLIDYPIDAWHISKSLMLLCLSMATAPNIIIFPIYWLNVLCLGIVWSIVFSVFYDHILKKP